MTYSKAPVVLFVNVGPSRDKGFNNPGPALSCCIHQRGGVVPVGINSYKLTIGIVF